MDWETFIDFITRIDHMIIYADKRSQKKLAAMQTIIAAGAYLGLPFLELAGLAWHKVYTAQPYKFLFEPHRAPEKIPRPLTAIITKNYDLIQPVSCKERVIGDMGLSELRHRFAYLLLQANIRIPNPSMDLLRSTYALKYWRDHQHGREGLARLCAVFNMNEEQLKAYIRAAFETMIKTQK